MEPGREKTQGQGFGSEKKSETSKSMTVISAKVTFEFKEKLNEIRRQMRIPSMSILVRGILRSFVEKRLSGGIRTPESEIISERRECIGPHEILGIPRGNESSSNGREREWGEVMTSRLEAGCGNKDTSVEERTSEVSFLKPWQEIVGNLERLSHNEHFLEVHVTTKNGLVRLVFDSDSPEAKRMQGVLLNRPRGARVALLRTDSKSNPILIREDTE